MRRIVSLFILMCASYSVFADEEALAEQYFEYLPVILSRQGLEAAEIYLLRAQDYAEVSSDLSLELARIQMMLARPRREILDVLDRAIMVNRWKHSGESDARLYKAWLYNELKHYGRALGELSSISQSLQAERLNLAALLGLGDRAAFRLRAENALSLYPADEDIISVCFRYLRSVAHPLREDRNLAELVTRRVMGHENLNNILYLAAPYIYDVESIHRLLSGWYEERGENVPASSLSVLLDFGVIDEERAADLLFGTADGDKEPSIDKETILSVFALLRSDAARDYFLSKLIPFSGEITSDADGDGIAETRAYYQNGLLVRAVYDGAQERIDRVTLNFIAGEPSGAVFAAENISLPFADFSRQAPRLFNLVYEPYPAAKSCSFEGTTCYFVPGDFYAAPARFENLCAENGLPFPNFDISDGFITERTIYSFAAAAERPSKEFEGAVEIIHFLDGIVISAHETLDGKTISETEFAAGRPVLQRVDTDLDGRLETIRHFARNAIQGSGSAYLNTGYPEIEYIEADWKGNGVYEVE